MKNSVLYLAIVLLFGSSLFGQNILPKPGTYLSVVDETATLAANENEALTKKLNAFKDNTGHELVIVLVKSLNGSTVENYASTLFNNWGIGKKGKDDGVLLLIAINDRKMRIETGYAAEAVLTDVEAAKVLDELLTPHFRKKEFYEGLELATNYIINRLNSDFGFESYALRKTDDVRHMNLQPKEKLSLPIPPFLIWLLAFGLQLGVGYLLLRKVEDGFIYPLMISIFYVVAGVVLLVIFSEDLDGFLATILYSTLFCVVCYALVLLPKSVGKFVGKILYYIVVFLMSTLFAFFPTAIVAAFVNVDGVIIFSFIGFIILFFYLIVTGKINLESSGGGSYSSSSSSYSSSGYSDSSSYSDSSYGGGSSGGGGASGSW